MDIVFWWNIPCAGMINVLKSYSTDVDTTAIVVTGELSESRKAMGWKDGGKLFPNHIILSDEEWNTKGKDLLNQYKDRLHVFNGITYTPRMKCMIEHAISNNIAYCNMSEAYFNLEKGWRKILKSVFMNTVLPFKAKHIASHSRGIICLSGGSDRDYKQFCRLGFKRFFPFGYFTDELKYNTSCLSDTDGKIHILCPGLLEHYKGVDILISALAILKKKGITNYLCHITGNGREKNNLINLVNKYNLHENIVFEGVLDPETYKNLLTKIDILVAPGRIEPWGIRINEAIQRGNVVIVSDGIGANYLIKESSGGDVFRSGSPADLANKLSIFLMSPDALLTAKKKNLEFKESISCTNQAIRLNGYIKEINQQIYDR